jgi:hypothetical protein
LHGCAGLLFVVGKIEQRPNLFNGKAEIARASREDWGRAAPSGS